MSVHEPPTQPTTTDLSRTNAWPYPKSVYVKRVLWKIVYHTVWKLCWAKIPALRVAILRLFGAKVSSPALLVGSSFVEMPWDFSMGSYCTLGARTIVYNLGGVEIGEHTVLSQDVYVCGGTHDYTDPAMPLLRKKIVIGSHVWIAAGAYIGPGVTIGDGAVVGARAVVVKDVPPWTVVAGNPAKVVKQRVVKTDSSPR